MALRIVRAVESLPRKSRYRQLRHYQCTAEREHPCHGCERPILPGDEYEASVVIKEKGGIYVAKYHVSPPCDPWPEDEEDCDVDEEIPVPVQAVA